MAVQMEHYRNLRVEDLEMIGAPEKFVELIEGELIHMTPAGHKHNSIAYRIVRLFDDFCSSRQGLAFGFDNDGFLIRRNPDTLLSPDASLFRARTGSDTTWLEFAPEVAVEVLSPSNNATEMVLKRERYFEAGSEQFWLIDPETREIEIYLKDGRLIRGKGDAVIPCEGIAEGLEINLAEIFRER
ncbi:MAG: hypothetical protein RLZZ303_2706 [Candidatus Hydrogenedentota bacterium]|jgi:Uma2 family endonuclease